MSTTEPSLIRVLHVDDEPDFADLVAEYVEQENDRFDVDTVTDAADGIARIEEDNYDCIVSDFDMPSMNGIEFLEAVREARPELPFILFTGKGSEEVASEAISAGVTDYLQKKTGTEQYELLANRIENAVAQHRAERRADAQERILTLLRDVNRALVRASTRDEIESAVTDIFVATQAYRKVIFGEYDAEADRFIPRTTAGMGDTTLKPAPLPDGGPGAGAIAEAIETGALTVVDPGDPTVEEWAHGIDYGGASVLPLNYHNDLQGLLILYATDVSCFDTLERSMLQEIGGDIAQALHTAETHRILRRHRTAVQTVPQGVFILDEDATIVLANESAAALADRSPDEITGRPFTEFVEEGIFEEAVVDWYLDSVRKLLSSSIDRDDARYETTIHQPDGEERVVEIHLSLRPFDGDFRGTAGIIRDITEQKRRERELEASKARYQRLVENAPIPIAIYDQEGALVYVNEAGVDYVGATGRDAILGESAVEFIHPEDRDRAAARMRSVIEEREPASPAELSLLDRSGERKEAIISTVPVKYNDQPAGQVVIEDVTEMNEWAQTLERQRDRLEGFASIVSHDLRNPLNVAKGRIDLAKAECNSKHLTKAETALERMDSLIGDLMTYAKVGQPAVDDEVVSVADLAKSGWETVETSAATLQTDATATVQCDPSRVQQLFENLFRNAIEHGGPDVTVTVGTLDDGFFVADDGPGVPEDRRPAVFEAGETTKKDGTGIGLAIVREIAQAHGWSITLSDSKNGGARFEVTDVEVEAP